MLSKKKAIMAGMFLVASLLGRDPGPMNYGMATAQAAEPHQPAQTPEAATRGVEPETLVKVASPMAGVIWFVGTEIKPGEQVPPAEIISVTIGKERREYRRLKKGDRVQEGQLLARLDDRLARAEYAIKKKKVEEAEAAYKQAREVQDVRRAHHDVILKRLAGTTGLFVGSNQQLRDAFVQWEAAKEQADAKRRTFERAKLELEKAQTVLDMHEIRCRTSGVIQAIGKHPGESVKRLETVLVLRITER